MKSRSPSDSLFVASFLTKEEMTSLIRSEIQNSTLTDIANEKRLNIQQLCQVSKGAESVSDTIAKAFGYRKVTMYIPLELGEKWKATLSD